MENINYYDKYVENYACMSRLLKSGNYTDIVHYIQQTPYALDDKDSRNRDTGIIELIVRYGNVDILKYVMEQKLKKDPKIFEKKYDYGRNTNILHFIAKYGNIDMLKYVIEQKRALNEEGKVDVDVTDVYETTPTFLAICNGNNEIAKYLIEECNANVNVLDCWSTPMLYCAIKSENLELVKYLIEHGADINLHGSDDNSMVHRAAFYGADNISKYIIEQQNDPKQFYDKDGVPMVNQCS